MPLTKSNFTPIWPELETLEDYLLKNENIGFCLACGEEVEGIEPDAEGYQCPACGRRTVFGIDNILLMGYQNPVGN